MNYLFVIERAEGNLSGFFPDVPGCVTTGETVEEILQMAAEALTLHLEDESVLPVSRPAAEHFAEGLALGAGDLLASVTYEPSKALSAV